MKSIKLITAFLLSLVFVSNAQINNSRFKKIKVFGNCAKCENIIESAGTKKHISKVDWDEGSKTAAIVYDTNKTTLDDILKDIALAGYDNELFLAPEIAYKNLPECCKYDRPTKRNNLTEISHENHYQSQQVELQTNDIQELFDSYISLKEALVKTNGKDAAVIAQKFQKLVGSIQMNKLDNDVHIVYMKYINDLNNGAGQIVANESKIDVQRIYFEKISQAMYALVKVAKLKEPIYYQYCPMYNEGKGATWLSRDITIKNPYYGSQMLSCGKVLETFK